MEFEICIDDVRHITSPWNLKCVVVWISCCRFSLSLSLSLSLHFSFVIEIYSTTMTAYNLFCFDSILILMGIYTVTECCGIRVSMLISKLGANVLAWSLIQHLVGKFEGQRKKRAAKERKRERGTTPTVERRWVCPFSDCCIENTCTHAFEEQEMMPLLFFGSQNTFQV